MHKVSRLIEQFIPEHYEITWDLTHAKESRTVNGKVTIFGEKLNASSLILHSKDLLISHVHVDRVAVTEFAVKGDELTIVHKGTGNVEVVIDFSLTMTDTMHGIYPCYFEIDGKKFELYATQFESHHAREAFPCVDEPEAKATFGISLTTNPLDAPTVLSNMPVKATESTTTHFETTPRMSTYLAAFVTGDLQRATAKTSSGVEVNVYATKAHPNDSLLYALDHATKTIEFFDDYFNIPYPLPKSDHIALPDFSSGAMENWGLVTYREIALLADPKTASISTKQYVAMVVAHELSHQWFGNLVTMKWWNNLWLNESFATIMEYLAPNHFHPEWDLWFEFSTSEGVMALRRDCIDGVQSVQVDVNHPDEISSLFDGAIVYAKGGRLMRMMQSYVGEDAFKTGLHSYFKKYQYKNTTGDNLWDELSHASGKDISALMNTWISQSGYPVVTITLKNDELHLTQQRFFVGPHEEAIELWPIPLKSNVAEMPELFETESLVVPFTSETPVHLNSDDSGHYIVHYDHELRARIIAEIKNGALSNIQRAQFLHEQALLARGGYLPSADLIELLAAYNDETDEKVWGILQLIINDLKKFVENDEEAEVLLRRLCADIARKQFERLGWDAHTDEPENDTQLRSTIISCMLYGEDEAVIQEAISRYRSTDISDLDPELRSLILAATVRHGHEPHIVDHLLKQYAESVSPEIQQSITAALTSTRNIDDIHLLLKRLPQKSIIRHQDVIRWFVGILANRDGRDYAWQWLRDNWAWIDTTFGSDKSHDYFPRYSANLLNTRKQEREYIDFFTPLEKLPSLKRTIEMGKKDMAGRIELIERDSAGVANALHNFYE